MFIENPDIMTKILNEVLELKKEVNELKINVSNLTKINNELTRKNEILISNVKNLEEKNTKLQGLFEGQNKFKYYRVNEGWQNNHVTDDDKENGCNDGNRFKRARNSSPDHSVNTSETPGNLHDESLFKTPLPISRNLGLVTQSENESTIKPSYAALAGKNRDKKAVVKRKKTVVGNLNVEGVAGAFRNFHFYVGNWNNSTTKEKVVEYINKFAKVNKIEELTTKYNYYKSFHVEVNDCYNSIMLNPES